MKMGEKISKIFVENRNYTTIVIRERMEKAMMKILYYGKDYAIPMFMILKNFINFSVLLLRS